MLIKANMRLIWVIECRGCARMPESTGIYRWTQGCTAFLWFGKDFQRCSSWNLDDLSPWTLLTGQVILHSCRTCMLYCLRHWEHVQSNCLIPFPNLWGSSVSPICTPQSHRKPHPVLIALSRTVSRQGSLTCLSFPRLNKDFWKTLGSLSGLHCIHFGDSKEKCGNLMSRCSLMNFLQ